MTRGQSTVLSRNCEFKKAGKLDVGCGKSAKGC